MKQIYTLAPSKVSKPIMAPKAWFPYNRPDRFVILNRRDHMETFFLFLFIIEAIVAMIESQSSYLAFSRALHLRETKQ